MLLLDRWLLLVLACLFLMDVCMYGLMWVRGWFAYAVLMFLDWWLWLMHVLFHVLPLVGIGIDLEYGWQLGNGLDYLLTIRNVPIIQTIAKIVENIWLVLYLCCSHTWLAEAIDALNKELLIMASSLPYSIISSDTSKCPLIFWGQMPTNFTFAKWSNRNNGQFSIFEIWWYNYVACVCWSVYKHATFAFCKNMVSWITLRRKRFPGKPLPRFQTGS